MKKIILAVLLSISTQVLAGDGKNAIQIAYALRDTVASDKDNPNRQGINLRYMRKLTDNITWDAAEEFRTERLNSDNGNSSTR